MNSRIPNRIAVTVVATAAMVFLPANLCAQKKYVGLTLCSPELQSPRPMDYSVRLDRTQNAYIAYREMPETRLVMIVVYQNGIRQCGLVRDAREFKHSRDVFDETCIESARPGDVVIGFFDQNFDPKHPERGANMRGPAVQAWRVDLKNLKFLPTSGTVTCVTGYGGAGADDGSDLAMWASERAMNKTTQPGSNSR